MRDILQDTKEYALSEIEKYGIPSLLHLDISLVKGRELARILQADEFVVEMGIYLMDIALGRAFHEGRIKDHVVMGIEVARAFLGTCDIDEEQKEKIIECVAGHHGTIPYTCIESEICANADCYRMLHPKGFLNLLMIVGERGGTFDEHLKYVEGKVEEKWDILSLGVCKDELRGSYDLIKRLINIAKE
jgi:hypothetical protein